MDSKSNKIMKHERGPNWEEDEKTIFFHCYENVGKVLEDPKKDFNTNSKKNQAWLCLMNKFNAHSNVKKREIKNLKKFWESEKAKSRKAFTAERNARLGTGGGYLPELPQSQDPAVEELIRRPHIVEWTNTFDSDGVATLNLNESVMDNTTLGQSISIIEPNTIDQKDSIIQGFMFKGNKDTEALITNDDNPIVITLKEDCINGVKSDTGMASKNVKGNKTDNVLKECELRVKRQKIAFDHDQKMNQLQILNQKLIMQATVAKRFEEHKLFKLQCEKLALEIKKIKENII